MLLKKQDSIDYPFIDNDGVSHPSLEAWLFTGLLGGCGCGSSENFGTLALAILKHFGTPHGERNLSVYDKPEYELMAHWFESNGWIEHGTSVGGAWLTDKGKEILDTVNKLME